MTIFIYTSLCGKHPELNGKRYTDYACPECKKGATKARKTANRCGRRTT